MNHFSLNQKVVDSNDLQLSPIKVNQNYLNEWNESKNDFVCLTKNGELISESLYRVGGFGGDIKNDYFMLLKYVESIYDFKFIKQCYPNKSNKELESKRKYLDGLWCIIDKNGVEKKQFKNLDTPYLVKNSVIYTVNNKYYNIETDEFYGSSYKTIESSEYLFIDNCYEKDLNKKGVMRINKKDGTWITYP